MKNLNQYGNKAECKHEFPKTLKIPKVSKNYYLGELICLKCGKFCGVVTRKAFPVLNLPRGTLEELESLERQIKRHLWDNRDLKEVHKRLEAKFGGE